MPDVPSRRDLVKGFAEAILSTPHVFEQVCRELNDQTKLDAVAIASVKLVHAIERELKREGGDAA
jgi:hypothetical protein